MAGAHATDSCSQASGTIAGCGACIAAEEASENVTCAEMAGNYRKTLRKCMNLKLIMMNGAVVHATLPRSSLFALGVVPVQHVRQGSSILALARCRNQ